MKSEPQVWPATQLRHRHFHIGLVILLATGQALAGTLAQKPLFLGNTAPPNVILAVDDSASMKNEVLMASGTDDYQVDIIYQIAPPPVQPIISKKSFKFLFPDGTVADLVPPTVEFAEARSPKTNLAYFDPTVDPDGPDPYAPWASYGAATFSATPKEKAPWDPLIPNKPKEKPTCPATSPTSADFPNTYDLTRTIQCSGSGYFFSMSPGMTMPKGTVFLPLSDKFKPPADCAKQKEDGWYTAKKDCACTENPKALICGNVAIAYFPASFYLPKDSPNPYKSFNKVIEKEAPNGSKWDYYEIKPENFTDAAEYDKAIQSFANWFTYYRKRHAATRGAIGAAFKDIQYMRLGVFKNSDAALNPVPTISMTDLSDAAAGNALFYNSTYDYSAAPSATNAPGIYQYAFKEGTPNMKAVNNLGSQFQKPDTIKSMCQKNAGILFTDGIAESTEYTAYSAGVGNVDGNSGPPYADSASDTMADIAMHYYNTNLNPNFPAGQVPVSSACNGANPNPRLDCQKNLHMNFYAVTLGLKGNLYDPDNPFDPYDPPAGKNPIPWPTNAFLNADSLAKQDDVWHATIDGRGKLLTAKKPSDIRDKLVDILNTIVAKSGTGSSAAANSTYLTQNTLLYQASFDSSDWSGEVSAYTFTNGTLNTSQSVWNASEQVPVHSSRKIFSYIPKGTYCGAELQKQGIVFEWDNLNCNQQQLLNTVTGKQDTLGQDRLDFLRGDTSKEKRHGGKFRDRVKAADKSLEIRLGDFVGSTPAYAGSEDYGYSLLAGAEGGTTYQKFLEKKADRTPVLYIGGNDGMLHAFRADNGVELFAYVPNGIYDHLSALTSPDYSTDTHRYFVDGSPRVADAYIKGGWKTVMVGTTGAGGRSLFALDVTNPGSFEASNVLWEISDNAENLPNLGYTVPQPAIVRTHSANTDTQWVVIAANGYNSPAGKAVLLVIDLATGKILKEIDTQAAGNALGDPPGLVAKNGLSTPIVVDVDQDRIADLAYAGDLEGNLWKFDLTDSDINNWKVAYGTTANPSPLFVACAKHVDKCEAGDRQPITAKPQAAAASLLQGGLMVFIGTGKYFEDGDNKAGKDPQIQSFYGLWDKNTLKSDDEISESKLVQQTIDGETTAFDRPIRLTSANAVDYQKQSGWYLDLKLDKDGKALGERVVSNPVYHDGRITFTTLVPPPEADNNQCTSGGSGWLMELYADTGAYLDKNINPIFDLNRDTKLDEKDLQGEKGNEVAPTGLGLNGVPFSPYIVRDTDYIYRVTNLSDGSASVEKGLQGEDRNGRMSWRQLH